MEQAKRSIQWVADILSAVVICGTWWASESCTSKKEAETTSYIGQDSRNGERERERERQVIPKQCDMHTETLV